MQAQYISRFTPRSMSPETLEAIFVQRKRFRLAERLIELIRESTQTENKHYRLLVGNRGIGKTHLISLIYHRLVKMEELRECLLIAWLPEEAYQIDSFLGFLMTVFEALKEEYPEEYEAELQEKVERLYQLSCGEQEYQAKELLRRFVGKKTLLLLIENLDMVFDGLEETGQHQLRAYLYNYKFCTILATSQSLFKEVKVKDYPFYGSFQFHHLEELSSDEAVDLLANIAQLNEDKELEIFLQSLTGKERVKAVHHLAGGNPRIYIVFSGFLSRESLDELVPAFMKMLDELTPYYQDRMRVLTARQRKIVNFLCDRRYACLLEDISQRCFLDAKSAKEELKELQTKGYLRMEKIGQERFYELREPLLRFCLQMKKQKSKPILLFVDFLRLWYSRDELEARLNKHFTLKNKQKISLTSQEFQSIEQERNISHFLEKEYLLSALHDFDKEDKEDPRILICYQYFKAHYDRDEFNDALQYAQKLIRIRGASDDFYFQGLCWGGLKQHERAIQSYEKALESEPDFAWAWYVRGNSLNKLEQYHEAILSYDKAIKIDPDFTLAWSDKGDTLKILKQYEKAIKSYEQIIKFYPNYEWAWINKGESLRNLTRYEEALESYDEAIRINPKNSAFWTFRAHTLNQLKQYEKALNSYDEAIKIDPNNYTLWLVRGYTLNDMKRHKEAILSYDKAIELEPNNATILAIQGYTLNYIEQYKQALIFHEKALKLNPESAWIWINRGNSLNGLKQYNEATISYEKAIQIDPKNIEAWGNKSWNFDLLGQYEESLKCCEKAIELGDNDSSTFFNLAIALFGLNSWREGIQSLNQAFDRIENQDEISSEDIPLISRTLFENYQDADLWRTRINTLIEIYDKHQALSIFAQGLTRSIPMLISSTFNRERVQLWLEIWQEITADRPEFELPLRLLAKAIEYKEKNSDPRVLLTLPIEEREILKQLLEEMSSDYKGR